MRHVVIAIAIAAIAAIAGCGGHSGSVDRDAALAPALSRDDIAHACVNAYACLGKPIEGPTMAGCLAHLDDSGDSIVTMYRPAQIRCLIAAGSSCAAVRACVGYSFGACSPDGLRCEGDNMIQCSNGSGTTLDCRHGLWFTGDTTCFVGTNVGCGLGTCAPGTPARCDGARVVNCLNGVLQVFDCAQAGDTCFATGGGALCIGTGSPCTASRCEGNQLIRCDSGREQRYACDAMLDGGTCVNYGRGGASCAFGPDCGAAATCAGNTAQLCVLGAQQSVDCVAAGFTQCAQGACIPATFP